MEKRTALQEDTELEEYIVKLAGPSQITKPNVLEVRPTTGGVYFTL